MDTFPIYVLAIGACPEWDNQLLQGLCKYLNRKSGPNWRIKSCFIRPDRIVETILSNLDKQNGGTPVAHIVSSYALFKLNIEFDGRIDYRILPWLEDEIKWYVGYNQQAYCAGYFFYPIFLKGRPSLRIFACCHTSVSTLDEVDCGDDFSYILRLSAFLHRHLYFHDADIHFPHIVAALLLQFGGDMQPSRITT